MPFAHEALDVVRRGIARVVALRQHDERLHDVAALRVGRRDRGRLQDRRMLHARRLDLEGADAVPRRDDHVVGPSGVPVVAVLVGLRGVLRVEPLAAEDLLGVLGTVPVAERVVRVGASAQADLAALAGRQRPLVLVQDRHVPARNWTPHRPFADLHRGEVPAEGVRLGEPVVVEHRDTELLAEPADHLGVERLARRARDPQLLRIAPTRILDRGHRPQGRGGGEHVLHAVLRELVQLLLGVEAALARVDELHRAIAPGAEQRADARRPRPLTRAVEQLALADVVAELEFLVGQQVAVGVQDALGLPGRAG